MKWSLYLYVLVLISSLDIFANNKFIYEEKILAADEAFIINVVNNDNEIFIEWKIEEKYYLYADSIKISLNKKLVKHKIIYGLKNQFEDEFFGKTEIYKNKLKISLDKDGVSTGYEISYQGCAEQGLCYPVQKYII